MKQRCLKIVSLWNNATLLKYAPNLKIEHRKIDFFNMNPKYNRLLQLSNSKVNLHLTPLLLIPKNNHISQQLNLEYYFDKIANSPIQRARKTNPKQIKFQMLMFKHNLSTTPFIIQIFINFHNFPFDLI